jgi:dihydrofolate reductase
MYIVGGATLVGSLMNAGLIDEVRVLINPLLLGGGKALFERCKREKSSEAGSNEKRCAQARLV